MKIFKPTWTRDGKEKTCRHWYIGFADRRGKRRRLPAFPSKRASERAALMLGELLSVTGDLGGELTKWLEEIPPAMRDKLIAWGMIDNRKWSQDLGKTLADHLADYVEALRADGRKEHHIKQTQSQINAILAGCGFRTPTDITSHEVKVFLAKGRGPDGYGERTYNAYLVSFKSFCSWLWRQRRATGVNPMIDCQRLKQTEFRKKRRALSDDEVVRLLNATETGARHHKLTGRERALIYRLCLTTGARIDEVRILTVASFDFQADPPTVRLEPCETKGKKAADMILPPNLAEAIQEHVRDKAITERAFRVPPSSHTAEMIKQDLAAAGLPYTDASGRDADVHALRHTFITNLARAGVHPAVAQQLARHHSIELTMKFYTHVLRESEIDAMQKLGRLSYACHFDASKRTLANASEQKNLDNGQKTAIGA